MTFAIAFSGAASSAIPRPPTPAGKTLEAGHPHIGEADTHQEHHDHHGQSLVTEYWFSVRVLSPTAWRRYCSFAKIISGSLRALTEPLTDHLETKIFLEDILVNSFRYPDTKRDHAKYQRNTVM